MAAPSHSYLQFGDSVVSWRDVTYVKIGNLGTGGSSKTHLTIATSGPFRGVAFAVKIYGAPAKRNWRPDFMREIHVLRDCNHPAIMKVIDEGMYHDKYPFVVLENIPETLSKALKEYELYEYEKLNGVTHLLSALNYLSRRDPPVVHRDIKPSNIFLREDAFVLGDFGLILLVDDSNQGGKDRRIAPSIPEMAKNYRTPELVAYHLADRSHHPKAMFFNWVL
jgi:serine/threonine protein kinase